MDLPRLEGLPLKKGQRALVRVDLNVPLRDGVVEDDLCIATALPTIDWLRERDAVVVIAGHLGRPNGRVDPQYSMAPVARRLSELLGRDVPLAPAVVGPRVEPVVASSSPGDVVMVENLRFEPGETKNDPAFCVNLAELADLYVNEAFGASHRAHASIVGPPPVMPHAGGRLLFREVEVLSRLLADDVARPFVAVLGGAKVSDKLEVIENLIPRVDALLIGGAMAYTFFSARGVPVGKSLVEADLLDAARDVESRAKSRGLRLELPSDHVVAPKLEAGAPAETLAVGDPAIGDRMGLDIGPRTIDTYRSVIGSAKTVIWNGPMGVFEIDAFAAGTIEVAKAVAAVEGTTVIGGGDSIAAVAKAGVTDRITHISTGGGASLEFLGGRTLPGVAALPDRL